MRAKYIGLLLLAFASIFTKAELPTLSQQSKIVLFTCGPGDELYAGFGHSAIWISDPVKGIDRLYNYGTFDFNTPNFYWKFVRGKLDYMLTVTNASRFINEYNYRKIKVTGQTLDLQLHEKQKLFDLIEENLLPENRFYKYDFFYDNCATRIRDIVEKSVDGSIDFNTSDENISMREILFPYLNYSPWTKFGINLILGLTSDKKASTYEYMYIPKLMQNAFANAIVERNNQTSKLVSNERVYLESKLVFQYNILNDPALFFGLLFLLIGFITWFELRSGKYLKWIDILLNSIAILAGLFLFFMWVGTDHTATNQNLNSLWLFPAQAIFIASLFLNKNRRKKLANISFFYMVAVSIAMYLWPQEIEISFLIISLTFALRYLFHARIALR